MVRIWIADYPEAANQRDKYRQIANDLITQRTILSKAANPTIHPSSKITDTTNTLAGDYYDTYETKVFDWYQEEKNISNEFCTFLNTLSNRISTAQKISSQWASKISLGHWEEH